MHSRKLSAMYVVSAVAALWALLMPQPGISGQYQFIAGKGNKVCEAYWKNLKDNHDQLPMACDLTYKPKAFGLSAPRWQEISPDKVFGLLERAVYYTKTSDEGYDASSKPSEQEIREVTGDLRPYFSDKRRKVYLATVDIFNDSRPRKVLIVRSNYCGPHQVKSMTSSWMYIVNNELTDIVPDDQMILDLGHDRPTVQLFEGRSYIESYEADGDWGQLLSGDGTLRIWNHFKTPATESGGKEALICEYKFLVNRRSQ